MREHFFKYLRHSEHRYFPSDVRDFCYESRIRMFNGLDVCMLGIGRNGHIAFNEPGTSFNSVTRLVELSETTREANARFFLRGLEEMPNKAYTIGISTILRARSIILVASGPEKLAPLQRAFCEQPNEDCPASALQYHPNVTVVLDKQLSDSIDQFRHLSSLIQ